MHERYLFKKDPAKNFLKTVIPFVLCCLPIACTDIGAWDDIFLKLSPRRMKLTFQNSGQGEDLHGFPVLVVLTPDRIDYTFLDSDGASLRFMDASGDNVLSHEVESFDKSGTSYIWVSVPMIHAGSDSDYIWIYYNEFDLEYVQEPYDVWSNGYAGVWHMTGLEDSSGNNNNGLDSGTADIAGRFGSARFFDGNGAYIDCGNDASLEITGEITISAWIKLTPSPTDVQRIVSKKASWDGTTGYDLAIATSSGEIHHLGSGGWPFGRGPGTADEKWHYIAATTTGSNARVYFDGEDMTSLTSTFSLIAGSEHLCMGRITGAPAATADFFSGTIDEVRISDIARSGDWIRAQYLSMTDNYIDYGAEEVLTPDLR